MTDAGWAGCAECGMSCNADEYHPYAACLMFTQCSNSDTVRTNLEAVRSDTYHQGRVAGLKEILGECEQEASHAGNSGDYKLACRYIAECCRELIEQQAQGGGE